MRKMMSFSVLLPSQRGRLFSVFFGLMAMAGFVFCGPPQPDREDPGEADVMVERYELNIEVQFPVLGEVDGAGEYRGGELVTIVARPYESYEFLRWVDMDTETEVSREDSLTFEMPERDVNLGAYFTDPEEWR